MTRKTTSRHMTTTRDVPIINPVAKFLFANPKSLPAARSDPVRQEANACRLDGIAQNNYHAPYHAATKPTIRATSKSSTTSRSSDKITGFYSMSTAYDGSTAVLAISFPGINLYPTWIVGPTGSTPSRRRWSTPRAIGFTRTEWNEGLPQDPTGAVRNLRQLQSRHHIPQPEVRTALRTRT